MTLSSSLLTLRHRVEDLRLSLAELVMTAREDMPERADVAAADSVAELVTDLQGTAEQAAARLAAVTDPYQFPAALPGVVAELADLERRYWSELRSYPAVVAQRSAIRGRSPSWRSWQHGVELSATRCEEPLAAAVAAVGTATAEIAEILTLYLPRGPAAEPGGTAAPVNTSAQLTTSDPISSRRSS